MVIRWALGITLFLSPPVQALQSLMFSPQHCARVHETRHQQEVAEMLKKGQALLCEGILYQNAADWTLWVNGKCMTARDSSALTALKIHTISAQEVRGVFTVGGTAYNILLKPGQYFFVPQTHTTVSN